MAKLGIKFAIDDDSLCISTFHYNDQRSQLACKIDVSMHLFIDF